MGSTCHWALGGGSADDTGADVTAGAGCGARCGVTDPQRPLKTDRYSDPAARLAASMCASVESPPDCPVAAVTTSTVPAHAAPTKAIEKKLIFMFGLVDRTKEKDSLSDGVARQNENWPEEDPTSDKIS